MVRHSLTSALRFAAHACIPDVTRSRQLIAWLLPSALLVSGCGPAVDEPVTPTQAPAEAVPVVEPALPPPAVEPEPPAPLPVVEEKRWEPPVEVPVAADLEALRLAGRAAAEVGRWSAEDPPGAVEAWSRILLALPADDEARAGLDAALAAMPAAFDAALLAGDAPLARRYATVLARLAPDTAADGRRESAIAAIEAALATLAGIRDMARPEAAEALSALLEIHPGFQPALREQAVWQSRLFAQSEAAARDGRFDEAERHLVQAEAFGSDTPALQDAKAAIAAIRVETGGTLLRRAGEAIDRLDLVAAGRLLSDAEAIVPQAAGLDDLRERLQLARRYGHFLPGQVFTEPLAGGGDGPLMVVIPHGVFKMGSPPDQPGHRREEGPVVEVRISRGFALAVREVTVGEFARFVGATRYRTVAERQGRSAVYDEAGGAMAEIAGVDWRRDYAGRAEADPESPVIHVAFEDAMAYAGWLAMQTGQRYRLPSEAEFEYALRAGGDSTYPWGNGAPLGKPGNLTGAGDRSPGGRRWGNGVRAYADGYWGPAPVGSFGRERFGTHDLIGNVSEWVQDCWHDSYRRSPVDGRAWVNAGCPDRVVRGASWASDLMQARSAQRLQVPAATSTARVGFRVARDL